MCVKSTSESTDFDQSKFSEEIYNSLPKGENSTNTMLTTEGTLKVHMKINMY